MYPNERSTSYREILLFSAFEIVQTNDHRTFTRDIETAHIFLHILHTTGFFFANISRTRCMQNETRRNHRRLDSIIGDQKRKERYSERIEKTTCRYLRIIVSSRKRIECMLKDDRSKETRVKDDIESQREDSSQFGVRRPLIPTIHELK